MDLSEFDGLEPVSEHELKTLIQHLPDGALGLFERRLILRVLELEKALEPKFDGTCELFNYAPDPVEVSLGGSIPASINLTGHVTSDPVPVDHSVLGEETAVTINFGDCDLDVQPMTVEEWTRAMNEHLNRGHY